MTTNVPNVTLDNGVEMPILGFGVYQIPPDDTERAVTEALEVGYRHIDTLPSTEESVGRAIAARHPARRAVHHTKLWMLTGRANASASRVARAARLDTSTCTITTVRDSKIRAGHEQRTPGLCRAIGGPM